MMKHNQYFFAFISFFILTIGLLSCKHYETNPAYYLSTQEQKDFKYSVARYINKMPKKATEETKFHSRFDVDYLEKSEKTYLDKYYVGNGDTVFFELSKIAPSLKLKKVATGGKLLKDKDGQIVYYEEVYRTWKMEEEELVRKTKILFDKFIRGEDLSPYYNQNSGKEEYIEFPDEHTYYDIEKRIWMRTNGYEL